MIAATRHRVRTRVIAGAVALIVMLASAAVAPRPAEAATVAETRKALERVRAEVRQAGREFDRALLALENTEDRIAATDKRMAAESKNLAAAEVLLGQRADSMYRGGGQAGVVEFVLGAASWEDFVTRLDYATLIATSDAGLVQNVKDTRARLARNKRDLEAARKTQAADVAVFKKKRAAVAARLRSKQAQYDKLLSELAAAMAREHPGRGNYPPGPNGQVFPVQGVYYYSDTWGAARSGGRHHKGTDIMARTGTPCVATTDGTVRIKSGGLGGLCIYLTGDNGWEYYYAHLSGYAVRGGRVKAGQLIGYVGATGNARGGAPHLHFQMGPHGNWINPYPYLRCME